MDKKLTAVIILILIIMGTIPLSTQVDLFESHVSDDSGPSFNYQEYRPFNQSLMIQNNTDFYDKAFQYNWTGDGTEDRPFVINNYQFKMSEGRIAVYIENTDVNFILKGCNITNSSCGIVLSDVVNATITNNIFYKNDCGVRISNSHDNRIDDNRFLNNEPYSISIVDGSYHNKLNNNSMWGSGLYFEGEMKTYSSQIITSDNTVNGKPVYYITSEDLENQTINNEVGQLIISNCSNARIEDIRINKTTVGIFLSYSSNIALSDLEIENNIRAGIQAIYSDDVKIMDVNSSQNQHGIYFRNVNSSSLIGNNVSDNRDRGFSLINSDHNELMNNVVESNRGNGIDLYSSSYNLIRDNLISENEKNGINFYTSRTSEFGNPNKTVYCADNSVLSNKIILNTEYGVKLAEHSENNMIYFNSFIGNQGSNSTFDEMNVQAFDENVNETDNNYWYSKDDVGNYWADWTGPDENEDHIVDEPYPIDGDGVEDRFPLTSHLSPISKFRTTSVKEGIRISWGTPYYSILSPVSEYLLYRGLGRDNISMYQSFNNTTTSYLDSDVSSGKTYYYQVVVVNEDGYTSESSVLSTSYDNIPPKILSHSPSGEEVPVDTSIFIEFSEPMIKDSVEVHLMGKDSIINGTMKWDRNNLTFLPNRTLAYMTTYTVLVNGSDISGNQLSTYKWTFDTKTMGIIMGKVVDSEGNPIEGALIICDTGRNTTTNSDGEFELMVEVGDRVISVEKEGYKGKKINVEVGSESPKDMDKIQLNKVESGGTSWFFPMAIFVILITILAIIAAIAFFKDREEEQLPEEDEFFEELYEEEYEEVSKEEFESWWEDK